MIPAVLFYTFAGLLLLCALLVVSVRNPVHSVCALIVSFVNAAVLFLLQEAEFLAFLLIIVYVGAVAVLFLFVVMMLGASSGGMQQNSKLYLAGCALFTLGLGGQLLFGVLNWNTPSEAITPTVNISTTNTHILGSMLYTTYILPFQIAGLILLVAMIGAITLTFRIRSGLRRQNIRQQLDRKGCESVTLVRIPLEKRS